MKYRDRRDVREGLDEVLLIDGSGAFLGDWEQHKESEDAVGVPRGLAGHNERRRSCFSGAESDASWATPPKVLRGRAE